MGFEIASISKTCAKQSSKLLTLVTDRSAHICHKSSHLSQNLNCSQLSFVTIGYNSQNWSQLSVLITIFTIIKSHLSLVFYGKNCHKWSKLTNVQNFHNCSKFWQLTKLSNYSKLSQLVTFVKDKLVRIDFFKVWLSLNKCGQVWTSLDKIGQVWTRMDKFEHVWTSLNKFGQDWTSLNNFKHVWRSLHKFGQVWTSLYKFG